VRNECAFSLRGRKPVVIFFFKPPHIIRVYNNFFLRLLFEDVSL
jgi:hypothetical protein